MNRNDALNLSVDLALAWGTDWLQPIQSRLAAKNSALSTAELDEYNELSQGVLKTGFKLITDILEGVYDKRETIKEKDLRAAFIADMRGRFPWMNEVNLKKILSQGLYYAWKNGLGDCIK